MEVGRHTYGADGIDLPPSQHGAQLTIGSFCSIAGGVTILLGGEHRTDYISTYPFQEKLGIGEANLTGYTKGNVTIGNDVWIGQDVTILGGVTIGHGAVIGANSVIASDVLPYTINVGNPAHTTRLRFTPPTIRALLALAWWDWPDTRIRQAAPLLTSSDVAALLEWAASTDISPD